MFVARQAAKGTRTIASARLGTARALPWLSATATRSFWDQKAPEQPKSYVRESSSTSGPNLDQPKLDVGGTDFIQPNPDRVLSPYLIALLAIGGGLVSWGLLGLYEVMTMWPKEIRQDLRSGLRAKRKGDREIAIHYLTRAWNEARAAPVDTFSPQALLKISGIGIALAGVVEEAGQTERAYDIYQDVLWHLRTAHIGPKVSKDLDPGMDTLQVLEGPERMRAVALAYKLGELAKTLSRPEEEEKWLVWSVEAILRGVLDKPPPNGLNNPPNVKALVEQLGLPPWAVRHNLAAPFEALGSFYARKGNPTYALPLYLQAISILVPPAPALASVEDKCRGAALMGNIAELIIRYRVKNDTQSLPDAIFQAESWAKKGLELVTSARKISPKKCEACEEAYAVLLYNLAMVRELSGDDTRARQLLNESLEQSKAMGLDEGIKHAKGALDALGVPASEPAVKQMASDLDIAAAASLE